MDDAQTAGGYHHNRLEEEAPRLLGIGTEPEFVRPARSALAIGRRKSALGLHHASRRPDRCRAQRARRYPRHRDLASALLNDDGGLSGAIRCAYIFHRRHHSSRARSPLCELHAKLSEPDSARGRPRSNVFSKGSNHSHSNKFTARGGK